MQIMDAHNYFNWFIVYRRREKMCGRTKQTHALRMKLLPVELMNEQKWRKKRAGAYDWFRWAGCILNAFD